MIKTNKAINKILRSFLSENEDDQSVYKKILNEFRFDVNEVFADMLMIIFAGFDTTSHSITSALYLLKKYPKTMKKILLSLNRDGISSLNSADDSDLLNKINKWEYFNYVMNESLRIDPPAPIGLYYEVKQAITICDIPISKGSNICVNCYFPHYNKNEWDSPKIFIPERFDPESDYFFKPNSQEVRDPMSYLPFSSGSRPWAGQALAKIESRVILSRILTSVEYEIDQSLLDNETARFNIFSQFKLTGKITKKIN